MSNRKWIAGKPAASVLRRLVVTLAVFLSAVALALLVPAGIDWMQGWIFLAIFVLQLVIAAVFLWRRNADIFVARSAFHAGTKPWDWAAICLLIPSFMAIFPVAGLSHGSSPWIIAFGYILLTVGMAGMVWVQAVNKFAEPSVRIQPGQKVIDTGPYAIVRHPMYAASYPLFAGISLSLGSHWALVPVAVVAILVVARTALEDRMLQEELPGYREYAERVRYRLLPRVW
jgi:protein-S-isoprenylcysteine O-methyltransferase Ste14